MHVSNPILSFYVCALAMTPVRILIFQNYTVNVEHAMAIQ